MIRWTCGFSVRVPRRSDPVTDTLLNGVVMKYSKTFFYVIIFAVLFIWGCTAPTLTVPDRIHYPPLSFTLPKAERIALDNGIIMYFIEDRELPLININAVIRTGNIYDDPGKEGLAALTGTVMRTGGTTGMTGDEIDDELDYIAADISVASGKESASASLSVLKNDLDKGLQIFSDILIHPAFERAKLSRAKELKIESLRRVYDNPQKLAFREFVKVMYRGNPRGRVSTIDSVQNITREDLVRFHTRYFFPANVMIAVTGDISKQEAIASIQKYFGAWSASGHVDPVPLPQHAATTSINYMYKDAPQSIVLLGQFAPGESDPYFYAFEIMDFIAGSGGFRSRIFGEVRNNLGLAYSAGSFYSPRREFGVFGAYAMTKTASTVKSLRVIRSIIDDMRTTPVSPTDLAWAKKSITNNFIFSFTSSRQIAVELMMLEFNKLPKEFLTTYRDRINSVTAEDVRRVADTYLDDMHETLFVLGDGKNFDTPLSTLGTVNEIQSGEKP